MSLRAFQVVSKVSNSIESQLTCTRCGNSRIDIMRFCTLPQKRRSRRRPPQRNPLKMANIRSEKAPPTNNIGFVSAKHRVCDAHFTALGRCGRHFQIRIKSDISPISFCIWKGIRDGFLNIPAHLGPSFRFTAPRDEFMISGVRDGLRLRKLGIRTSHTHSVPLYNSKGMTICQAMASPVTWLACILDLIREMWNRRKRFEKLKSLISAKGISFASKNIYRANNLQSRRRRISFLLRLMDL